MPSIIKRRTYLSVAMLSVIGVTAAVLVLTQGQAFGEPVPAHRVTIRFQQDSGQGGVFEVISWNAVTKVLPPSDELPTMRYPVSGFYYELQSGDGTVLYRRIIENPILIVVERPKKSLETVASDQERPSLDRKVMIPQKRVFSLLIPRASGGDQLVLFSSPFQPNKRASLQEFGRHADAVEEVARIFFIPSTPQ
jgi:hypothetical protein